MASRAPATEGSASYGTLQFCRGSFADFATHNPTLKAGEIGYATDKYILKIGDGFTAWNSITKLCVWSICRFKLYNNNYDYDDD